MDSRELNKLYRATAKAYLSSEKGYDDREQLQEWRKEFNMILHHMADKTNEISARKISLEEQKHVVRAEEFARIEAEDAAKQGKKKSATAITTEVANTEAYKKWIEDYSKAYGAWQAFQDLQQSVKMMIDSISSHMRNIQTSDYLDPK